MGNCDASKFPVSEHYMNEIKNTKIGFLLFPGFPMACLTSMIEPLRAANEIKDQQTFSWVLLSEKDEKIESSANVMFECNDILTHHIQLDYLFILSAPQSNFDNTHTSNGILRSLMRHGAIVGGISGGVFPLVRAGIHGSHPVSVHWCYKSAFEDEFPHVIASDRVIESYKRCITASGATAAFDIALKMIDQKLDASIATEVACWFQHPMMRSENVGQVTPIPQSAVTDDTLPKIVFDAIALMAKDLTTPVSIAEIAETFSISPRQIERLFKRVTGQNPTQYYRTMRMNAARQLVIYTNRPISSIAQSVGYSSTATLLKYYEREYGVTPKEERSRINLYRAEGNRSVPMA